MISAADEEEPDPILIDRALCAAAKLALPLGPIEPINSAEEKGRILADPRYNPQFRYAPQDTEAIARAIDDLESLVILPDGVGRFFVEARAYLLARLDMRRRLGDADGWQQPLYPLPPPPVVQLARSLLAEPPPPLRPVMRPFSTRHLQRALEARLAEYGLSNWSVQARPNLSSTNTDSANLVVNVRADMSYSLEEMKRLVVHEVDTHVLRAANGASQPYRIFAVGAVPSYLMTEEGLAVINEERMGYIDPPRTRTFAGRLIAALKSVRCSFSEVYRELCDLGFARDEAYVITRRAKRGLSDTTEPGGFIKDQAYLWGRVQVEEHVLSGGDLSRIYVGKVALEHLPYLKELGLRPPRHVPLPYS